MKLRVADEVSQAVQQKLKVNGNLIHEIAELGWTVIETKADHESEIWKKNNRNNE